MEIERGTVVNPGLDVFSRRAPFGPYGLFANTVKNAAAKLLCASPSEGVWSWSMTGLLLGGVYAAYLTQFFDAAAIGWVRTSGSPLLPWLAAVTPAGKFHWYMLPALAVIVSVAVADWPARNRTGRALLALLYAQACFALGALLLGFLANNAAKLAIGRARPALMGEFGPAHFEPFVAGYAFASFPSGHATACGTVAAILTIWFPRWTAPAVVAGLVLASSRIAVGAHYPSDVVAGFVAGMIGTLFIARWLGARRLGFRIDPSRLLPRPRHAQAMRLLLFR